MEGSISASYEPADYPRFAVAVDIALFSICDGAVHIGLVRREEPPFEGRWALPGGFVRENENLDEAARRKLAEETSIPGGDDSYVEQLGGYGDRERDRQMRVVTVAYLAVFADLPALGAGGEAAYRRMIPLRDITAGGLAFDHARIVEDALQRIRSKLEYTTFATTFLPPVFTIGDVREVYEAVWGARMHKGNFQRNFRRNGGCFVREENPAFDHRRRTGRPAQQWWSLKGREQEGRNSVALLEHALVAPREVWRHRLDRARGQRTFVRTLPEVRRILRERGLGTFDARFTALDSEGQRLAVWCVLSGEGAVLREDRETVVLIARRLRDQGLATFQRLREEGPLYAAITSALKATRGDVGLEWPKGPVKRVRAYRPVTDMNAPDWCDCVVRALRDQRAKESVGRDLVEKGSFAVAQERYGIRTADGSPCKYLTPAIRERVRAGLNLAVRDGYVGEASPDQLGCFTLECRYSEP